MESAARFLGGAYGFVVAHITPEAFDGGPIALIKDGDEIEIDAKKMQLNLLVDKKELAKRKKAWKQMKPKYTRGVLAKYRQLVGTASEGAVTDRDI